MLCQAPHSTTPSPYADVGSDKLNSLLASDDDLSEPEEVPTAPTRMPLFFLLCAQRRVLPQWTPKRASEESHEAVLTLALGQAAEASCGGAHTAYAARFFLQRSQDPKAAQRFAFWGHGVPSPRMARDTYPPAGFSNEIR